MIFSLWKRLTNWLDSPINLPKEWRMSKEEAKWWDEFEARGGVW